MRRRLLAVAMAAAVAVVVVAAVVVLVLVPGGRHARRHRATTAPITGGLPHGEQFGASVNRLFNDQTATPHQIDAQLAALRATGATIARSDALWEASEPTAPSAGIHRWSWGFDDTIAADLAAHGLTWLAILDYSAPWAQSVPGQDHSPPRSPAAFAAYAGAFAARYGPGGAFWHEHPALRPRPVTTVEIWNEPDNGEFWVPRPSAAAYARLYAAARDAIHAADPSVRAVVGGLVGPASFLPAMVHADPALSGGLDGVAIHPYGRPAVVLAKVRAARRALDGIGLAGVPLYVTEVGWTTSPPGALDYVDGGLRPEWIERVLRALAGERCGVVATVLYTWVTPQRDPADSQDWFGISGTASSEAFSAGLRAAAGAGGAPAPCDQ